MYLSIPCRIRTIRLLKCSSLTPAYPPLDRWTEQFQRGVNGTYQLRGFEATMRGAVTARDGQLLLKGTRHWPDVALSPLSIDKIQWDRERAAPKQPTRARSARTTTSPPLAFPITKR